MTNNDEMALKLKAAAEKATPGNWYVDNDFDVCSENYGFVGELHGDNLVMNADFIATASPANILALLAERDADKKVISDSVVLFETLRQRIAELEELTAEQDKRLIAYAAIAAKNASEARTVSVKLPQTFTTSMYGTALYEHDDIVAMLAAAGINLEVGE